MCDFNDHDDEPAVPLGPPIYQRADPNGLRFVDSDTLAFVLAYLATLPLANHVDRVVLFGRRATGDGMNDGREYQVAHQFMVVLDNAAPADVLTGMPGYRRFVDDLNTAARAVHVSGVEVMLCHRAHWAGHGSELLDVARRGVIVAARL